MREVPPAWTHDTFQPSARKHPPHAMRKEGRPMQVGLEGKNGCKMVRGGNEGTPLLPGHHPLLPAVVIVLGIYVNVAVVVMIA